MWYVIINEVVIVQMLKPVAVNGSKVTVTPASSLEGFIMMR